MAQYVDESLGENEKVVLRGRWPLVHWIVTWSVFTLFVVLALGAYAWIPGSLVLPGLLILVGAWFLASPSIRMITTEFAVTSKRVVLKWGWLNRKTAELAVESVESVQLDQTIWGRVFGYGRLLVTGTGDARIHFPPMAEPVRFRRAIESGRRKNDAPKPAAPAPAQ